MKRAQRHNAWVPGGMNMRRCQLALPAIGCHQGNVSFEELICNDTGTPPVVLGISYLCYVQVAELSCRRP